MRVEGLGCRVQGAGCRVQGAGSRAQGAGFGVSLSQTPRTPGGTPVQGLGFRVRVHGQVLGVLGLGV